jgi:hypothetical protein
MQPPRGSSCAKNRPLSTTERGLQTFIEREVTCYMSTTDVLRNHFTNIIFLVSVKSPAVSR